MSDITGRDGYIMGKALAYAAAFISTLPVEKQEGSDMLDMLDILKALPVGGRDAHVQSVFNHTGVDVAKLLEDAENELVELRANLRLVVNNS